MASVAFGGGSLPDAALQVQRNTGDPERDAATNMLVARSEEVAERVRRELGTDATASQLLSRVRVEVAENADVLYITAVTGNPGESARLANAFAREYIDFEARSQVESIQRAEDDLRRQLAALPVGSTQRAGLEQSLQRLGELRAVANGDARVIGRAVAPAAPSGLGLPAMLVIAVLLGLAVAALAVFVLESLDRRVASVEELEREYGVPALTVVPQDAFTGRRATDRANTLEPFRILRTALEFTAAARALDTLLVTSAVTGEGKTTVAVDLAHAVALTGRRVVLVELDLRRPTFAEHFSLDPRYGVTTALTHREPVSELLVQPAPALPNLSVLPSGRLAPNPSELLGSDALGELLLELATRDTMVIVDAPPVNPVADTQVLLNRSEIDAAIVVARLGDTTRDDVRRARAILDRHLVQPIGIVVTGVRDTERYGYTPYEPVEPVAPPSTHDIEDARSRLRRVPS
jgi:capsular exopolysaccharide synthesis family protein